MFYLLFLSAQPRSDDSWSVSLANYIRHHDVELLSQADKCLSRFEEEVLPAESFVEFCDVAGSIPPSPSLCCALVRSN